MRQEEPGEAGRGDRSIVGSWGLVAVGQRLKVVRGKAVAEPVVGPLDNAELGNTECDVAGDRGGMYGAAGVERQIAGARVEVKSNSLAAVVEARASLLAAMISLSGAGTDCRWSRLVEMVVQAGVVHRGSDWEAEIHEGNLEMA